MLRHGLSIAAILGAMSVAGCCTSPPITPSPPGPCGGFGCGDADISRDGGLPFTPPPSLCEVGASFGASCEDSCPARLTCFRERHASADVDVPDAGTVTLDVVAFPGGMCSRGCTTSSDCNDCGVCVPWALAGRARLRGVVGGSGVCRLPCDRFSACPVGYACDGATGACMEACVDDAQCRFATEDTDGDGDDDALVYEPESALVCLAGRCDVPGGAVGAECFGDEACDDGQICVMDDTGRTGRCGRVGCSDGGCGESAACIAYAGTTACVPACTVGAEGLEEIVGSNGHGRGCDAGFACAWLGVPGDPAGACTPSNYNDVAAPNTGQPCTDDSECWSPYGRGRCIEPHEHSIGRGVCIVTGCVPEGEGESGLLPGVVVDPITLCDPDASLACRRLEGRPEVSACVDACVAAEECLPGFGCVRVLGTEARACVASCEVDSDCTAGGRCQTIDAAPCGPGAGLCACR